MTCPRCRMTIEPDTGISAYGEHWHQECKSHHDQAMLEYDCLMAIEREVERILAESEREPTP